jgi:hypothetical protein
VEPLATSDKVCSAILSIADSTDSDRLAVAVRLLLEVDPPPEQHLLTHLYKHQQKISGAVIASTTKTIKPTGVSSFPSVVISFNLVGETRSEVVVLVGEKLFRVVLAEKTEVGLLVILPELLVKKELEVVGTEAVNRVELNMFTFIYF